MADQYSDMRHKAGETAGHAQVKKDEVMGMAQDKMQVCKGSCQESTDKAGGFVQQTGEQMKQMAQGAVDTVKNAVGMGDK